MKYLIKIIKYKIDPNKLIAYASALVTTMAIVIGLASACMANEDLSRDSLTQNSPELSANQIKPIFNPVVGISARTNTQWKISITKSPMQNINSPLIINSVNIGIFPNLEVGVVPIYYSAHPQVTNFNVKYNFWKGDQWDWAVSHAIMILDFKYEYQDSKGNSENISGLWTMQSHQIAFNYRPTWSKVSIGGFHSYFMGAADSNNIFFNISNYKTQQEYGLDFQIPTASNQWLTLGIAHLRKSGYSPYEDTVPGLGVAYSLYKPKSLFSRPSVGVYTSKEKEVKFLFSTTFYED